MKLFVLLILAVFASEKNENGTANDPKYGENNGNNEENLIVVKIEEDEYYKVNKKSKYVGAYYDKSKLMWKVQRRSKNENKNLSNGYYDDEETAAYASDTLARKLMDNGEQGHKINFPDNYIDVYPEKYRKSNYQYIGMTYNKKVSKWKVQRWSKIENKVTYNGYYDDQERAAHASDTLARKLMENGEQKLKLNFPDDPTEVHPEQKEVASKFIGVAYNKNTSKWYVQRHSKNESKRFSNGYYDDEETAAHASDTLARKLMENGELKLKINFPDNHTEVHREKNKKKRKREKYLNPEHPQNE